MIDGEGGTGEGDGYGEMGWRGGVCRGRERERESVRYIIYKLISSYTNRS